MKKISFDPALCTGCAACQMACNDQRDILCALQQKPLRRVERRETAAGIAFYSVGCTHCGRCISACPQGAIGRNDSGYVVLDSAACIGCGGCMAACPLSVISRNPETNKAEKCDGCWARIEAGLLPACVHTCPIGALTLKD